MRSYIIIIVVVVIYLFIKMQHKMTMYNIGERDMQGSVRALKAAPYTITVVHEMKTMIHKNTHIMHIKLNSFIPL